MSEGDEVKITFQFRNNGNDGDKIRVSITNAAELEEVGFSFPGGTSVAEDVAEDGVSTVRELTVRAPSEVAADERYQYFQAQSEKDAEAPVSEVSIPVQLEVTNTAGGLGGGLEEVDKDTLVMYGSIGAAVLFGLIFVVALARTLADVPMPNPCMSRPLKLMVMLTKRMRTTSTFQNSMTCSQTTVMTATNSTMFSRPLTVGHGPSSGRKLGRCGPI